MKNKKGFTLIELLVVIAIIGLLSTLAVVALNNARIKSRDARRVSDVKQIQTALELYLNDVGSYPESTAGQGDCANSTQVDTEGLCLSSDNGIAATCAGTTYMAQMPADPLSDDDGGSGVPYCYTQDPDTSYSLTYELEGATAGIISGPHVATPAGMVDDNS